MSLHGAVDGEVRPESAERKRRGTTVLAGRPGDKRHRSEAIEAHELRETVRTDWQ